MADEEENDRGFKVSDKRIRFDEETDNEEKESEKQPEPEQAPQQPQAAEDAAGRESEAGPPTGQPLPPIDFVQFIISLASSAMIHLGDAPHPVDGKTQEDFGAAQQTIDILSILEEKTRGNLSAEEESLLKNILSDLKIRFVQKKPKII
jgi:hypothetical protein